MVIKREVLDLPSKTLILLKIVAKDKENHLETNRMSLGTATSNGSKTSINISRKENET